MRLLEKYLRNRAKHSYFDELTLYQSIKPFRKHVDHTFQNKRYYNYD